MPATFTCIDGPLMGKSVVMELGKVSSINFCDRSQPDSTEGQSMPVVELDYVAEGWCLRSDVDVDVNGNYVRDYILKSGDELRCHDNTFVFESDEIVSLDIDSSSSTDSESDYIDGNDADTESPRRARRLSASHDAVIHSPVQEKKGIFERVGKALRRKDEKNEKLEDLEEQRQKILHQAGRFVLEYQGGMGLPSNFMMELFSGKTVTVEPHQLKRVEIEQFRILRDRLIYLDSAINARRLKMGLQEEDRNPIYDLHLRKDIENEENQAYEAMDDLGTIEHEHDITSFSHSVDLDFDVQEESPTSSVSSKSTAVKTEIIARRSSSVPSSLESGESDEDNDRTDDQEDGKASRSSARRRSSGSRARRRRR